MIVTTARIKYKYGDTIQIRPISDIHIGSKHCDEKAFKAYLKEAGPKCYFLGIGDLYDAILLDDPRYRRCSDATETEAQVDELVELGEHILRPYADRIIGLGDGNHERRLTLKYKSNLIKRLCARLDCDYLGYSGLVRILLREERSNGTGGRGRMIMIRYHHGWGGGSRTQGADLTKFSKDTKYWQADIFLYGHVHKKQVDRIQRFGLVGNKLVSKPRLLCICGTFLKTYSTGPESTYSEEKGYPPIDVGGITINIQPDANYLKMWADT